MHVFSGVGPDHGRKASWIGASGDQTFIKMDESLVNAAMLSKFHIAADKNTIRKKLRPILNYKYFKDILYFL